MSKVRATTTATGLRERLKQFPDAFRNIPDAFRLVWEADRRDTLGMAGVTAIGAFLPAAQAWVGKLIIDGVVNGAQKGTPFRAILPFVLIEFALLFLGSIVSQTRRLVEELLDHRLGHHINTRIIRKALGLELHYFEDAEFYDKMQNARRQSEFRALAIINSGFLLLENSVTLISFLVILLAFKPLIALVLLCATIPTFVIQSRYSRLNFRLQNWRAPESRKMQYFEHLLTVDGSAKEVKLFGLGEPLLARYDGIFQKTFEEDRKLAWWRSSLSLVWGMLAQLTYYGSYLWIIHEALARRISLGEMTLYLTLFRQSQATFEGLLDNVGRLYENGLFIQNLFSFLALPSQRSEGKPAGGRSATVSAAERGIEFRDVSFRYPGHAGDPNGGWAVRNLSLQVHPGEKIALVGQNGAGKTTLIKLLSRLYDPSEGVILLDGVDLRDYPLEELRRKIGVIFQDFVRYQLTLRENVGFGSVEALADLERIRTASRKGGADEIANALGEGFETTLGNWFENGHELSGGQWQKIALSRAFMREGSVLVLDEPTSALDAEREYEIFQSFRELTAGKIAFLISHRFSTVRMADRIVVMEAGRIIEQGSHTELLARAGTYARLFEMQAEGYR